MDGTNVPNTISGTTPEELLAQLVDALADLSPQLRKAAAFVLDHPTEVAVSSARQLADAAGVTPNTLVRLARAIGFEGFDELRAPFRNAMRTGDKQFPDRAEWLQELSAGSEHDALYGAIVESALMNVQRMFADLDVVTLKTIADAVVDSRRTYVVGVGANYALAHNFAYLVGMAMDNVVAVPGEGNAPIDSIVRAGDGDVVIAMTFAPYRSEVVETAAAASVQAATVVAVTDSHASPIAPDADYTIITPSSTPQFFPSTLAASAALESLASFIVADADPDVVATIDRFHQRRYELGVYWKENR